MMNDDDAFVNGSKKKKMRKGKRNMRKEKA